MATTSLKTNLRQLYIKYPQLENDLEMCRDAIIEQALKEQHGRNRKSKTLKNVMLIAGRYITYITDKKELKVIQDRISDHFNYHKKNGFKYEKWYKKLPVIFKDSNISTSNNNLQAVFNLDEKGLPNSMSVQPITPLDETYTITIKKDSSGEVVFNLNSISQTVTMTSLSMITKAIS